MSAEAFTREEILILIVSLALFGAGVLLILSIFVMRVVKSYRGRKEAVLQGELAKLVSVIMVNSLHENEIHGASFAFHLARIGAIAGTGRMARDVLAVTLVRQVRNVSGGAKDVLVRIYTELSLQKDSERKLRSFFSARQTQGIRELSMMEQSASVRSIERLLRSSNKTVREEALLAMVRLDAARKLGFLTSYQGEISLWMRITLFHHLQNDQRRLPDFSQWLHHENLSVVLFSLSMIRKFRKSDAVPRVAALLGHPNEKVAGQVIQALGELDAFQYAGQIAALVDVYWANESLCLRIADCLGRIADDEGVAALRRLANHPDPDVAMAALRGLMAAGAPLPDTLDPARLPMVAHLEDQLLR